MHLPFCLVQFAHVPEEESAIRGDRGTFCSRLALQPHNIIDLSAHMGGRRPMFAGNTEAHPIQFTSHQKQKNVEKLITEVCCIIFSKLEKIIIEVC